MIESPDGRVLFARDELACRHCGEVKMAPTFVSELRSLRMAFGRPMSVNSCCRCPEYNEEIGGHPRSLHKMREGQTQGACAIDIAVPDNGYRLRLLAMAITLGWSVGVYQTFLHLDRRELAGHEQGVFWGAY